MKRLATAAVFSASLAATVVGAPANAAFPGENGKIVFVESNSTWVANASGNTELSRLPWRYPGLRPNDQVDVSSPEVAPDGTHAVVTVSTVRRRSGERKRDQFLALMTLDGTVQTKLLDWPNDTPLGGATFSPDGGRIAFDVYANRDARFPTTIYVMNSDGTGVGRLTTGSEPAFSPDGGSIAFSRHESGPTYDPNFAIYAVGTDRTAERRLGPGSDPDYSPDGDRIVFEGKEQVPDCDYRVAALFSMASDGTDVRRIRQSRDDCFSGSHIARTPSYSPNGERVLFTDHLSDDTKSWAWVKTMPNDGIDRPPGGFDPAPWENVVAGDYLYFPRAPDWGPAPEATTTDRCSGHHVTISGTELADRIRGTSHRDVILARGGDDAIDGRGGRDLICAGGGADEVAGGAAPDAINGGAGLDTCPDRSGRDTTRSCERTPRR